MQGTHLAFEPHMSFQKVQEELSLLLKSVLSFNPYPNRFPIHILLSSSNFWSLIIHLVITIFVHLIASSS